MIDEAITELKPLVGVRQACAAAGRPQASHYRRHRQSPAPQRSTRERKPQPRALSVAERAQVRAVLNSPEHVDKAPASVYHELLDAGVYLASVPTMYRILREHDEVHERRRQAVHPARVKPELVANEPNQCWSWDITKLRGPAKWTYFYLYVVLDVFSRYVVGWLVADAESSLLAERLITEAYDRHGIKPGQLGVHADRGPSMKSNHVAMLLANLGVTKTHSRPHVSDDNPYSEAQFKTLKYRPDFPERFGCIEDARGFNGDFFRWYNNEHHHTGLGLLTPADVHFGRAEERRANRLVVLAAAHHAHPERFVAGTPIPPALPTAAWINKPKSVDGSVISRA